MSAPLEALTPLAENRSTWKRAAVASYGAFSYALGVAALVAWIASMFGILSFAGGGVGLSGVAAAAFNLALMLAFALQHSVMARPRFKNWLAAFVPPAAERSTFVLATGLFLGPVVLFWQPMPTTIWSLESAGAGMVLHGLALAGWAYLFLATFAFSHFELFGLRQVYQYARGIAVTPVPFRERWMYRIDRHPIMTGALVGMWVTPHMQLDHLLFAATATIYIVIGVHFEELGLLRKWGSTYEDYRSRVRSIVPTFRSD